MVHPGVDCFCKGQTEGMREGNVLMIRTLTAIRRRTRRRWERCARICPSCSSASVARSICATQHNADVDQLNLPEVFGLESMA